MMFLMLFVALLPLGPEARIHLMMGAALIAAVPPIAFSYLYWRRHRPR